MTVEASDSSSESDLSLSDGVETSGGWDFVWTSTSACTEDEDESESEEELVSLSIPDNIGKLALVIELADKHVPGVNVWIPSCTNSYMVSQSGYAPEKMPTRESESFVGHVEAYEQNSDARSDSRPAS